MINEMVDGRERIERSDRLDLYLMLNSSGAH